VLNAFAGEQFGECTVVGVAPGVVREDASDRDSAAAVEGEGTLDERQD
jgi:hypothetical protein